jgi:hypothetical protein
MGSNGEGMSGNWDKDAMKNKGDNGDMDGGKRGGDSDSRESKYRKPSPYGTTYVELCFK